MKSCMISANCTETCVECCMALQVHLFSTKQGMFRMRLRRCVHTGCCCMTLFPGFKQADEQSDKDTAGILQEIVQQCIGNKAVTTLRPTFSMLHERLT